MAKYNVTSTSNPTQIGYNQYISGFSSIEIDGVAQPSVVSAYTFSTTGEHTVMYTLSDQTTIGAYSLRGCYDMTGITIPSSVTYIGNHALRSSNLTSITSFAAIEPTLGGGNVFSFVPNGTLYIPQGSNYETWINGYLVGWTVVYI